MPIANLFRKAKHIEFEHSENISNALAYIEPKVYRQSICLSCDKLDILLRNSIYKSCDLFDIFC